MEKSHPLWAFQFYFTEQQVGITIAICMGLIALWMQIDVLYKNKSGARIEKLIKMSFSCFLLILVNGTYQALTTLYITVVVGALLVAFLLKKIPLLNNII